MEEPWLFDILLSAGVDLYKWKYEFDEYDKDSFGGKLRFGYPLYDFVRGNLTYTLDLTDITDVADDAVPSIQQDEGEHLKSSISPSITLRLARQHLQRQGGVGPQHRVRIRRSRRGFGFRQARVRGSLVLPGGTVAGRKLVWATGGEFGWGLGDSGESGEELPVFERYFPGGINSIRGSAARSLGPRQTFPVDDLLGGWQCFALLCAAAFRADVLSAKTAEAAGWCLTPAYCGLIPTYAVLWVAGRWLG